MSTSIAQTNRETISRYWGQLDATSAHDLPELVRQYTAPDIEWHGPQPFNDIDGVESLIETWWLPLRRAFPDLRRRCDVLLAGSFRGQDWVSASGYYEGTFAADWLGIAATGEKTCVRFGEIMALEAGKIVKTYWLTDLMDVMQQGGFHLGWAAPATEGSRPRVKYGGGIISSEQDPRATQQTLRLVEAMLFGLVRKDQPMSLYWTEDMFWNSPSGVGTATGLDDFLRRVHHEFLRGLGGGWSGSHNARYAEGRFAVSTGWPSLVAEHTGFFLGQEPTGNYLSWRIMDFWERKGDLLTSNWVHIDMVDVFMQMDVDIFERYRQYRREKESEQRADGG